jgi:hypothetical protein
MLSKLVKFEFAVPFFGQFLFNFPSVFEAEELYRSLLTHIFGDALYGYRFDLLQITLGLFVIAYLIVIISRRIRQVDVLVTTVSLVVVTAFSTLLSLNMSGGPRYTFAPSIMVMVLMVSVIGQRNVSRLLRGTAVAMVVISVVISAVEYRPIMMDMAYSPSWPKWRDELELWRRYPGYPMKIWPPPWEMKLGK